MPRYRTREFGYSLLMGDTVLGTNVKEKDLTISADIKFS